MRTAIDQYKKYCDTGLIPKEGSALRRYPTDLDILSDGVEKVGTVGQKIKFLRRIPFDPFTKSQEWGKRSYQDDADSDSLGSAERLRRLHRIRRDGARWHEIQGTGEPVTATLDQEESTQGGSGFTPIELMVVAAIIGILAADGGGAAPHDAAARQGGGAQGEPLRAAQRDRPVLHRQGKYPDSLQTLVTDGYYPARSRSTR